MLRQVVPGFLKRKFRKYVSTQVPAAVAACEFDCQENDCPAQKWEVCERRLEKADVIEHMPEVVMVKPVAK